MLYRILRATAAITLRWYYTDIAVQGAERIPRAGPLLIVANHPNALIDPLVIGTVLPRRILLTAKATLFERRVLATILHVVGVVPLRRANDESSKTRGEGTAFDRNAEAFQALTLALRRGAAVLIFPEGVSHDDPTIAPLRSGAARMVLQARKEGVTDIRLIAIGLIFEQKERPDTRVLVRIGEPFGLDSWLSAHGSDDATALTREIQAHLRAVTLNFASADRAARAVRLARILSALATEPRPVSRPESLSTEADLALRVDSATAALADAGPAVARAADELSFKLEAFEDELGRRGIGLKDLRISTGWPDAGRFILREGPLLIIAVPALLLGWLSHWLPLRVARALALSSLRRNPSRDQPAMRTILLGLSAVVIWYAIQAALLQHIIGAMPALIWLALAFSTAHLTRMRHARLRHSLQRVRTFVVLRTNPTLQRLLIAEIDELIAQAFELERALTKRTSSLGRNSD